ncbi:unnamed protein product [Prorocentrum cordatum]|uniref:Autophagy-related protein 9 n=1 Tax=Prorocentrum cordatum TaxID=2364126 RepID=A0ABN9XDJ5_9DINO|nr:unnamed protein product [Polarella glacialis]
MFVPVLGFLIHAYNTCGVDNDVYEGTVAIDIFNCYQDFARNTYMLIFIIQSVLMYFVWKAVSHDLQPSQNRYLYWGLGCLIQVMARDQMGKSFWHEVRFWKIVFKTNRTSLMCAQENIDENRSFLRFVLSYLANFTFQYALLFFLPLQLMRISSDIDFVTNSVAIIFIVRLDDLDDPLTYEFGFEGGFAEPNLVDFVPLEQEDLVYDDVMQGSHQRLDRSRRCTVS